MDASTLERILMVEDEHFIRDIVVIALQTLGGFTVRACASGEEALKEVEAFAPDLILLDVMMPGMDGPTTFSHLRQMPKLAGTPIAFMTAQTNPEEMRGYKELGASGVIAKPFDPVSLPQQVRELWTRATQEQH